ncbi:MAG: hypothetical protein ACI4U5_06445 [Bacilli bacterium]
MKIIKLALILSFTFLSLHGVAPTIKQLLNDNNIHTIKRLGFGRDESEYQVLPNKYIYLTVASHFQEDELYLYMKDNDIFNVEEYKEYIATYDTYFSSNTVGVFYLTLELLDNNDSYYKITFTIIVTQDEDDKKYEVVPYDENIDYTPLNPISITLENEKLLSLKELFSLIQEKAIFDFDEYISLKVHKDTYSSSLNQSGNYEIELSLVNVVEDDFSLKINVIVIQNQNESTSSISSDILSSSTSSSLYSSSSSSSSQLTSCYSSCENSSISSNSEEIEYTKLNTITIEVYNDRIIPLFELYDIIEQQGIFNFSEYLEVIAYYDTYSTCNKKVGVYYVDVHMVNVVEDTFEMRIQVIVRQNRTYDSSSSATSSSSSSSSYSSISSSSSEQVTSNITLPKIYVEIFNYRLLELNELYDEIQRQGLFDFYQFENITVVKDFYSSSNNKVGLYRVELLLEDANTTQFTLEINVIVKQDRSSKEIIPVTSLSYPEDEYTSLDTIQIDLTSMPLMNIYQICDYITQKGIYNFDEYLQILPIRDTYSSSSLQDGTYYIDCELINVVEDIFIITIEININAKKEETSSSSSEKNFFEKIFESIKNFFINIFNSIKNIFKK